MKKIISLMICVLLVLNGCSKNNSSVEKNAEQPEALEEYNNDLSTETDAEIDFSSFSDENMLANVESAVYGEMEEEFGSDDYKVEDVSAVYYSKEYLDELEYNSKSNIWFGYSLDEIKAQYNDVPFVFTLGEDGETTVTKMESPEDIYGAVLKNVAIGTGVVLLCVTVSVLAPEASAVSIIFTFAASKAKIRALQGAVGGISVGIVNYICTGDLKQATKAALYASSEGYKYGAIFGSVEGGIEGAMKVHSLWKDTKATGEISPYDAEKHAQKIYGGEEQKSYLNGKEVGHNTPDATRPDIVRKVGNKYEAIEVKRYDLENNMGCLKSELNRQISSRNMNLPENYSQRIAIDVRNKGYTKSFLQKVKKELNEYLDPIYKDIPIDFITY